ncbi:MAG: HD domain-containing protein [Desulfobacteraceae bacterium]|nr:HD domain-containing protein [Desulfobacteraceae bacterium]
MIFINPKFIPEKKGVFLVGGCVRDHLLGRPVTDIDLAVEKNARSMAAHIASAAGRRVVVIGKADKRIYRIVTAGETYDVSGISGPDIYADLLDRDFTVNAMAVDMKTKELLDPAGGKKDLSEELVRMVCPGAFDKDPLRLLRAFRIAAVLGFSIEPATLDAISARSEKISQSAGERIRDEWLKMLQSASSSEFVRLTGKTGLLFAVFPELRKLKGCTQNRHHRLDAFEHTMSVYRVAEAILHENRPALIQDAKNSDFITSPGTPGLVKHAALFHDIAKPETRSTDEKGNIHFYGHEKRGAEIIRDINMRIRFSNKENLYTSFLVKNHLKPLFLYMMHEHGRLQPKSVARFFMKTQPRTPELLMLAAADAQGKDGPGADKFTEFVRDLVLRYSNACLCAPGQPRLVTGRDLISELGLEPSPLFSEIIGKVEEMRLAGLLKNREQALRFIRKKWGKNC